MARRTPFPFRDHYDPAAFTHLRDGAIPELIDAYEDALLTEYKSGDVDVASFHEGLRTAFEGVLVDLLGIDQSVMDAYWGRAERPEPATTDLPYLPGTPLISYEQVAEWSGVRLNAEQWEALDEAIPHSSIPESIATLVATIKES